MNRNQRIVMMFGLLLISVIVLGCASSDRIETVAYQSDFDQARSRIAEAERAGAAELANAELGLARSKLRSAEQAADDGEVERARRLAMEAAVDADYAVARARNRETQQLAAEVKAGLQTLEEELRRGEAAGGSGPRP